MKITLKGQPDKIKYCHIRAGECYRHPDGSNVYMRTTLMDEFRNINLQTGTICSINPDADVIRVEIEAREI